jgi:hypothetical protein
MPDGAQSRTRPSRSPALSLYLKCPRNSIRKEEEKENGSETPDSGHTNQIKGGARGERRLG